MQALGHAVSWPYLEKVELRIKRALYDILKKLLEDTRLINTSLVQTLNRTHHSHELD